MAGRQIACTPIARPVITAQTNAMPPTPRPAYPIEPPRAQLDGLSVASAVCGFTAIIPVISQVAGLALGIAGLLRIRRARRAGRVLTGRGWAWAGIVSSTCMLFVWLIVVTLLTIIAGAFLQIGNALPMTG